MLINIIANTNISNFSSGVDYSQQSKLLFGSSLTSAPANFSVTGEFAFSGGALQSTGTSANTGWDSFATFSYLSSQERQMEEVYFKVNSLTSSFRVLKYNTNSWAKAGSVAEIDFENSLIKLWAGYAYPTIPVGGVIQTVPITLTVNTAHDYKVQFRKENLVTKIILTNITTGEINTLTTTFVPGSSLPEGVFRGQAAIAHVKGSFTYSQFNYYALNPTSPRIAVYGDSYVDGYSLSTALESRWTYLVYNHEAGNALISGWGGNSTTDLLARPKDYESITPKNVILQVGYNTGVYNTWRSDLESLISTFNSKGCNVILVTYAPIPTVAASANIAAMNAYVMSSGHQYLDIAQALTVGGDRVTLDGSLILPDGVHPNATGHALIYAKYLALSLYDTFQDRLRIGLVSYYTFDTNGTDSKALNNGTLVGTPTFTAAKISNGLTLNGTTQYVTLTDNDSLSFGNAGVDRAFSFSGWIKSNSLAGTNYIIAKRLAAALEYQFAIDSSGRTVITLFSAGAGSITLGAAAPISSFSTGVFKHLVCTYDGSKTYAGLKIYIDGVLQVTTDVSSGSPYAGMNNTAVNAYVGGFGATAGLNGIIDEFGIWSKALTQSAVTSLYNSGSGLPYGSFT